MPVMPVSLEFYRPHDAPIAQVARDFGVSESCLQRWLKLDDVEKTRGVDCVIRLLEQENEVLRRAAVYGTGREPKIALVRC
jgi:transposase